MFWKGLALRLNFAVASASLTGASLNWTWRGAVVKVEGEMTYTICVFGEPGIDALLGAVTLEELGLGVDPINQRLVPIELLLIGFGLA
jgi:hypothetical protein